LNVVCLIGKIEKILEDSERFLTLELKISKDFITSRDEDVHQSISVKIDKVVFKSEMSIIEIGQTVGFEARISSEGKYLTLNAKKIYFY
jgi:hypothetical protein